MKKAVALFLICCIAITTLGGCTTEELAVYQSIKSIMGMQNYIISGTENFELTSIQKFTDGVTPDELNEQITASLTYQGCVDYNNNQLTFDCTLTIADDVETIIDGLPIHLMLDNSGENSSIIEFSPILNDFIGLDESSIITNDDGYYVFDLGALLEEINSMEYSIYEVPNPYEVDTLEYFQYDEGYSYGYDDGYWYGTDNSAQYNVSLAAYSDGFIQGLADAENDMMVDEAMMVAPFLTIVTTLTKPSDTQIGTVNSLTSLFDDLFTAFLSNGGDTHITKNENVYSLDVTLRDLCDIVCASMINVENNPRELRDILLDFASTLTDEQVLELTFGSFESQQEVIDFINLIIDDTYIAEVESGFIESGVFDPDYTNTDAYDDILEFDAMYNPTANITLEQTGEQSYELSNLIQLAGNDYDANNIQPNYTDVVASLTGNAIIYGTEITVEAESPYYSDESITFTADQKVNWSIEGNEQAGTAISSTGVFTPAEGETAESITIIATSAYDNTIIGEYTLQIAVDAEAPTFGTDLPATMTYSKNTTSPLLEVDARANDGGTVSYQWYQCDENGDNGVMVGQPGDSYLPETDTTGNYYYYVVATNTNDAATGITTATTQSSICQVVVSNFEVIPAVITTNAPNVQLQGDTNDILDAVITPDDNNSLANGSNISVHLNVEASVAPQEDQNFILAAMGDNSLAQYLDISLIKNVDGVETEITETNAPIRITIDIPESYRLANRTFEIIRVHEGVATVLPDLDTNPDTITFETNLFSTYAIAYNDADVNPGTGDNTQLSMFAALALVSLAAAVYFSKKNKKVVEVK